MPIYSNIDGLQKQLSTLYANVGGTQKQLSSFLGNVNGSSVELMAQPIDYWVAPYYTSSTMATNTRTRMVANSATVASNGTFTLINPSTISGRPVAGKYYISISTSADSSTTTSSSLYYATNSSGGYYGFSATYWSSTDSTPDITTMSYNEDVVCVSSTLYIKKDIISSFYRWTQYNLVTNYSDVYTASDNSFSDTSTDFWFESSLIPGGSEYIFGNVGGIANNAYNYIGGYTSGNVKVSHGTVAYHISSATQGSNVMFYDGYYTRTTDSYSQGTATGKYMFALSSTQYPANGSYSGYWYNNKTTIS